MLSPLVIVAYYNVIFLNQALQNINVNSKVSGQEADSKSIRKNREENENG